MSDAIKRLLGSTKAMVMFGVTVLVFVGVYLNRISFEKAVSFLTVTLPAWLLAVGIEDAAQKHGAAQVEAVKASMRPPPMPGKTDAP